MNQQNRGRSTQTRNSGKKKKGNATMSIFTLLIVLVIAVMIIVFLAVMINGNDTSDPGTSDVSSDASQSDTSRIESTPASTSGTSTGSSTSESTDTSVAESADESDDTSEVGTKYTYKTDITAYLWAIEPENRDAYLVLVNSESLLSSTYIPTNLTDVRYTRSDRNARLMVESAEVALYAFLKEAAEYNIDDVTVTSAYRSYSEQSYLFENKVSNILSSYNTREEAEAAAARVVARPGTSEHQTGLVCDMHNMSSAQQSFGKTEAAKWLAENAYKFGFILRYEEDKQDITNIIYEPWHFRFVGRYHATQMKELDMCLEEYVEYLKNQ